ncbi:LOW QUALITY PROTEIN: hypothetical protein MXB_3026 [Myxobolus squamalis]|nr:LOW QUALITY PROTEIN: hypothetical protein MXB_3026 [Myxobolus squamalis]
MEGVFEEKLGLTTAEAYYLHKIHGKNDINITSEPSIFYRYISHFKDSMIMLLLASALVSAILGEYEDAVSIFIAIFIVVTVAFIQEYNSDQSVAAISKLLPPQDGLPVQIMAVELVPGDFVILRMGDKVPADIKLVESINLKVDESNLSGESRGVDKHPTAFNTDSMIQNNILYMGTFISYGHAKVDQLFFHRGGHSHRHQYTIRKVIFSYEQRRSAKIAIKDQHGISWETNKFRFNNYYLWYRLAWYNTKPKIIPHVNYGCKHWIIGSLAVAAIPEGLPIVVTVTLALGTIRMAKKRAIVKKLHVVETLGCVTIFCADKTGTITTNNMSVVSIYTSEDQYIDLGLMVDATVSFDGIASIHHSLNDSRVLRQILKTCCVCNNAQVGHDNTLVGQSTDCALLSLVIKCGYFAETLSIKRLEETPFSSETKWMSVEVEDPDIKSLLFPKHPVHYIKGAPEIILSKCKTYMSQNQFFAIKDDFLFKFHSKISNFSSNGFRTLAVAYGDSSGDYIFLGLVMLADPIRPDIAKTLANFRSLGVECKILTGDSKETACSVGDQLRSVNKLEMNRMISEAHLFYRITPVDKINIVKSLREQGHVVAMAGDGVNDAIALRAAHVGISMGKFASDACKEAADVVLTDDNIKSLIWAVREGKTIFKNIQNFVRFQISSYYFGFTLS